MDLIYNMQAGNRESFDNIDVGKNEPAENDGGQFGTGGTSENDQLRSGSQPVPQP